ncbi:MAG: hypothetical protein AUI52_05315 [Acidobacteria bacterium 13_1_40CM_2_68_10]|nr:MAG: hypothetical protein AUI52_05315 [Acidobacteria bacterium 13_1_40CM_2_68_10]
MRTRLRPGEELAAVVRRHVIVLGGPFAVTLFLAGCLIGAWFVKRPYVLPAVGMALAVSAAWASWRWLHWRSDLWAVTSQRVIDESGVLSVRAEDSPLDKINNIICTQSLWGRMLGYGALSIQTAAEVGSTTLETVARPMDLKETILEQQEKARHHIAARYAAPSLAAAGQGLIVPPGGSMGVIAGTAGVNPAGVTHAGRTTSDAARDDTKECPYCAETIKSRAKVCRFCGRILR